MEEGVLSSDPNIASLEVAESIGEESNPMVRMQEAVATQTSMAMTPVTSMAEAMEDMGMEDETDGKILGLPRNVVLIGAVAVAGFVLLPRLMR